MWVLSVALFKMLYLNALVTLLGSLKLLKIVYSSYSCWKVTSELDGYVKVIFKKILINILLFCSCPFIVTWLKLLNFFLSIFLRYLETILSPLRFSFGSQQASLSSSMNVEWKHCKKIENLFFLACCRGEQHNFENESYFLHLIRVGIYSYFARTVSNVNSQPFLVNKWEQTNLLSQYSSGPQAQYNLESSLAPH